MIGTQPQLLQIALDAKDCDIIALSVEQEPPQNYGMPAPVIVLAPRWPGRITWEQAMKEIRLSQNKTAIVDDSDYERINRWKWSAHSNKGKWYAVRFVGTWPLQECIRMHRTILDAPAGVLIDHRDGDGLNNTRSNLRLCNTIQNAQNRNKQINNTSGYKGVSWAKWANSYRAQIWDNTKKIHLGYFKNAEDAARAYDVAAQKYHGEFAVLNFK
jgi:hypothetical protein